MAVFSSSHFASLSTRMWRAVACVMEIILKHNEWVLLKRNAAFTLRTRQAFLSVFLRSHGRHCKPVQCRLSLAGAALALTSIGLFLDLHCQYHHAIWG